MNFSSSTAQNVSASGAISQLVTLKGSKFTDCNVEVKNSAALTVTSKGTLTTKSTASLVSALSAAANNAIQQSSTQSNGWLATGSNSSNQSTNIQNNVSSIINTTINSSTVQNILAQASGSQIIDGSGLTVKCNPKYLPKSGYNFTFDNNILASSAATGIADAITEALSNDTVVGKFINSSEQETKQENEGLSLPDISGLLIPCIILLVICCCLLVGGGAFIMMSKSGGSS
jgi:hypothetical protein